MSRTNRHKIEGKFNNGLIKLSDIPENIYSAWNRRNFDVGKFRSKKKKIIEKQHIENSLINDVIN